MRLRVIMAFVTPLVLTAVGIALSVFTLWSQPKSLQGSFGVRVDPEIVTAGATLTLEIRFEHVWDTNSAPEKDFQILNESGDDMLLGYEATVDSAHEAASTQGATNSVGEDGLKTKSLVGFVRKSTYEGSLAGDRPVVGGEKVGCKTCTRTRDLSMAAMIGCDSVVLIGSSRA